MDFNSSAEALGLLFIGTVMNPCMFSRCWNAEVPPLADSPRTSTPMRILRPPGPIPGCPLAPPPYPGASEYPPGCPMPDGALPFGDVLAGGFVGTPYPPACACRAAFCAAAIWLEYC